MTHPIKWEFEFEIHNLAEAKSIVSDLDEKERELLLEALNIKWDKKDKIEQKESLKKSLEFEKDTFKIDSTWWEIPTEGKFAWKWVKVNPAWDVTEDLTTWEQIFIDYDKFLEYVAADKWCTIQEVEKKYLMTKEEFKEKMKDMPDGSAEYKEFYNKDIEGHLAGYWSPDSEEFYEVGERSNIWLADGYNAGFHAGEWDRDGSNKLFGFSGRLLKN